jgi:hypothetical protein
MLTGVSVGDGFEGAAAKTDASGVNSLGGRPRRPEPWPGAPASVRAVELHSDRNLVTGKMHASVALSLVPAREPWEVPALLGFDGWNECPMPELIAAVLREWGRLYGAVPVCLIGDVMECIVDRPPQCEAEAMSLAAEHWILCDDIVGQGTQTVRKLAMELWRSPQWFFWWD